MSTLTNSSSEDLSSVDKNPFRGRFARAFFSSCMGLPRNNAAYAANSDFEWDSVSVLICAYQNKYHESASERINSPQGFKC
ncbi:uncharacterized protein TNCT_121811 [Trichonephila clavata]|uniref:Uncharacterized protein n=1 Tax=Trichonephila clavata TaxID=2740835 RepID=A0A8X6FZE6_TRICU|nr:uncharacterized protein TNCT_121811 [Trichonephila clavata]